MTTLPMASDTILGSRDPRLFQPLLQLDGIEPEQVSPFEVRNAPLEHEAPDVPFVDVQLLRHLLDREQSAPMAGADGKPLVVDQADLLGLQGAPASRLAPVRAAGHRAVTSSKNW